MTFRWQYPALVEPIFTGPEVSSPDKWFQPFSEPVRDLRSLAFAALVASGAVTDPTPVPPAAPVPPLDWFQEISVPVLAAPPATLREYVIDPTALIQAAAPTFFPDKWFQPFSVPVTLVPSVAHTQYVVDADALTRPEAVSIDKWLQPLSVPVLPKAPETIRQIVIDPTPVVPLQFFPDKWFQPFSVPVLPPPRAAHFLFTQSLEPIFQSFTGPGPAQMEWFVALSEPVLPLKRSVQLLGGAFSSVKSTSIVHAKYGHRAIVRPNQ